MYLLLQYLVAPIVMLITFTLVLRFKRPQKLRRLYLPLLIIYLVLGFPIFQGYHLWPLEWLPQILWSDLGFMGADPNNGYQVFSAYYTAYVPMIMLLIGLFCSAIFVKYVLQRIPVNIPKFLVYLPIANVFVLIKVLWGKSRFVDVFLIFFTVFSFYMFIAPFLLLAGIDSYFWYFDFQGWLVGYEQIEVPNELSYQYMHTDYIVTFHVLMTYLMAIFSIPLYKACKKFELDLHEKEHSTYDI